MRFSVIIKLILGFLALSMGAVGLLLPVWPTTPFVLLALGCFSSTPAIRVHILKIRLFREYYDGYAKGQGLCRKTVFASLAFLWSTLILSCVLVDNMLIIFLLSMIGITVTVHILWMAKTKSERQSILRIRNHE